MEGLFVEPPLREIRLAILPKVPMAWIDDMQRKRINVFVNVRKYAMEVSR
jgi:hypothetical protein